MGCVRKHSGIGLSGSQSRGTGVVLAAKAKKTGAVFKVGLFIRGRVLHPHASAMQNVYLLRCIVKFTSRMQTACT